MKHDNNECFACGVVAVDPELYSTKNGEKFFQTIIIVERKSKTEDEIPVKISERADGFQNLKKGERVYLKGTIRSFNSRDGKLVIYLFADFVYPVFEGMVPGEESNSFNFQGEISKKPVFRKTKGWNITDVILWVPGSRRGYYIPCIFFDRNARYISRFEKGTKLKIAGRFQSRQYRKKIGDTEEVRTAYEVAVMAFELVEEQPAQNEEPQKINNIKLEIDGKAILKAIRK